MGIKNYNGNKFNNLRHRERMMEYDYNEEEKSFEADWPTRDNLPKGDPAGDVDPSQDDYLKEWDELMVKASENYKHQLNMTIGYSDCLMPVTNKSDKCTHPNKYKNVVSASMKFWYCRDCGQDLGDIK